MLVELTSRTRWRTSREPRLAQIFFMEICGSPVYFNRYFAMLDRPNGYITKRKCRTPGHKQAYEIERTLDFYGTITFHWRLIPAIAERRDGQAVVWLARQNNKGAPVAIPELLYRMVTTKYRLGNWSTYVGAKGDAFVMCCQRYRCDSPWDNNLVAIIAQNIVPWDPPEMEVIKAAKNQFKVVIKPLDDY